MFSLRSLRPTTICYWTRNIRPKKKYTEAQKNTVYADWLAICDEYYVAKKDGKAAMYLRNDQDLFIISQKIKLLVDCATHIEYLVVNAKVLKMDAFNELLGHCIDTIKKIEPKIRIQGNKGMIAAKNAADSVSKIIVSLDNKFRLKNKKNKQTKKEIPSIYESYVNFQNVLGYSLRPLEEVSVAEFIEYEKAAIRKAKPKKGGRNGR